MGKLSPVEQRAVQEPIPILCLASVLRLRFWGTQTGAGGSCDLVLLQVPFFASKCRLGPNGVEEVLGVGKLSPVEEKAVQDLIPILRKNIDTGVEFANKK